MRHTWIVVWADTNAQAKWMYFKTRAEARQFATTLECYAYIGKSTHKPREFGL